MRTLIFLLLFLTKVNCFGQLKTDTVRLSNDLYLVKLSEHAYLHVSFSEIANYGRIASNGLIYIDDNESFLFDTPMTDALTEKLTVWLIDTMKIKIIGFIPNHWHNDCMGGLRFLQKLGIKSYANQRTINIAKSKGLPVPEQGFGDSLKLQLNGKAIQCYYFGAAHSTDNIVVWIPSEKILFPGCMVKSIDAGTLGNTVDGDLKSYPQTIDRVLRKFPSAKIVIPGHGSAGGVELIEHTKDILSGK